MEHNYIKPMQYTVKNVVYRNTPGQQYFTVSMVTHTVTMETVKYCSPGGVQLHRVFYSVALGGELEENDSILSPSAMLAGLNTEVGIPSRKIEFYHYI